MTGDHPTRIWDYLANGRNLQELGLPLVDGRLDLRGLVAPEAVVFDRAESGIGRAVESVRAPTVRGAAWCNLDLSGAALDSLRWFDSTVDNCVFEGASCKAWRVWGTTFSDTSFKSARLDGSALGSLTSSDSRNTFQRVAFENTDLRRTSYISARMVDCSFVGAKLAKVDFQGTVFERCKFEGHLKEVVFNRHAFRGEQLPANEMIDIDFRGCSFELVEFRGLKMDRVRWPEDDNHYIIDGFPEVLDRLLANWRARSDLVARSLAASFGVVRKWVSPEQRVGVISRLDLLAIGGEAAVVEFEASLRGN